ncbi:MAG: hypothetical protein AB8B92_02200 [Gammaproteobacteria bacterium]
MRNKINSLFLVFSIVFLLFACASVTTNTTFGPIQEDNFQSIFLESLVEDQQDVIFYSRAIWFPNKNGFKFLPAGKKSRKGVIVYTNQNIYFSEWNAKQYKTLFSAGYDQVEEARLAANELFGRIVIKRGSFNSFEILGVNGPDLPDKDETEIAYEIIVKQK